MSLLKKIFGEKKSKIKSYEDFWHWFQNNEKAFFNVVKGKSNIEKYFFSKLSPKLNELNEGFYYLAGMYNDNTVELIITPEGAIKNIVFVEDLINAAPMINGWLFTALKPSLDIHDVNIDMAGCKFNAQNLHFYSNDYTDFPDEIDISIVHNDLDEDNKDAIVNGVYIFLDNFLGELNFATTVDNINIIGKADAQKELISIEKLKDYLIWREKEFVEKYEGKRHDTENDNYSGFEAELKNGKPLLAVIDIDLLEWDSKASHPWILNIEIKYNGESNNGMPDDATLELLEEIENEVLNEMKDFEGYLYIGRQTADNSREIYFACKDFRRPAKVLKNIEQKYYNKLGISYDIYKDKYWKSLSHFMNN